MFYTVVLCIVAAVHAWRGLGTLRGKRSTPEVQAGKCVPLFDKVSGVCQLLFALGYALLGVGFFCKWTLEMPVPPGLLWGIFVLPVLTFLALLVGRSVLKEENFY